MALLEIKTDPSLRELRWFAALLFPLFFGLVGGAVLYATGSVSWALGIWVPTLLVSVLGLVFPAFMRVVYVGWMFAVLPIGLTISTLVFGAIYYLLITPIGLLARATGRDPLRLKRDPSADSHWVPYDPDEDVERYFRQF